MHSPGGSAPDTTDNQPNHHLTPRQFDLRTGTGRSRNSTSQMQRCGNIAPASDSFVVDPHGLPRRPADYVDSCLSELSECLIGDVHSPIHPLADHEHGWGSFENHGQITGR
jgi:hypothetical protein